MPKPRLLVSRPVPQAVTDRARADFDADLSDDRNLPADEVIARLARPTNPKLSSSAAT